MAKKPSRLKYTEFGNTEDAEGMNNRQIESPAASAGRRLIIVLAIVIAVVIYAYGVQVTDIDLEKPLETTRQDQVQRALRELLSPRIFTQDVNRQENAAAANFRMRCSDETIEQPTRQENAPYIVLSAACGESDEILVVEGFNFEPNASVNLLWNYPTNIPPKPLFPIGTPQGSADSSVAVDSRGYFKTEVTTPKPGAGGNDKIHQVSAQTSIVTATRLSQTTSDVISKMIETVFLALVATTLSIPFSVLVSFFAAHNLMRPVKMLMGSLLVGFVLLPIGWWLGVTLLAPLGAAAINLASGKLFGLAAGFIFMSAVATRPFNGLDSQDTYGQVRSIINRLLLAVGLVVVLGILAGLMLMVGRLWSDGLLGAISNFFHIIGRLIELLMGSLAGLIAAFTLATIGMSLATQPIRGLSVNIDHFAGGALGAVSGAVLFYGLAAFGAQAALLGMLTPIIAAALGAQILPLIYRRLNGTANRRVPGDESLRQRSTINLLSVLGALITFAVTFLVLDVQSAVVAVSLPDVTAFSPHLVQAAAIGAVLGGIIGFTSGVQASFPAGSVIYNITRTILNILRSIEPLIMGLVFVSWVGIGPFAGLLALTLHSIASLGKLYSEQIESIDAGPIEAIQATGANRLQTIIYAVVPQIIPPYIAFTMYRWDINVRMSTIIGFVGGGGIGFLLQQQINLLRYRDAGVAVLAIAIVVSILDYASASLRERWT
jgi:phosphonate ABC transporter permease subunit PhnE